MNLISNARACALLNLPHSLLQQPQNHVARSNDMSAFYFSPPPWRGAKIIAWCQNQWISPTSRQLGRRSQSLVDTLHILTVVFVNNVWVIQQTLNLYYFALNGLLHLVTCQNVITQTSHPILWLIYLIWIFLIYNPAHGYSTLMEDTGKRSSVQHNNSICNLLK